MDCFVLMECEDAAYFDSNQLEAGQLAFSHSEFSVFLLDTWLSFCCNKNIVTDDPNICGRQNFPDFVDHRHDQSIITNLKIKHAVSAFDLSIFSAYSNEGR